ncbi:MAG: peroxiredoxin [Bacteroidota bacterium]
MKTTFTLIIAILLLYHPSFSQDAKENSLPLIGESAPKFTAVSTRGKLNFPDDYFGKWKILFSHPADFTPVCTSELLELAKLQEDFKKMNTALVVISTDGLNSHIEWIKSMESIDYRDNGKVKIDFPLVSDAGLEVSKQYGMLHPNSSSTKDIRAVFIIDPGDRIRTILYYPDNVGRNMEEIKRVLTALQEVQGKDLLAPANWDVGEDLLMPSPKSADESAKMELKNNEKYYSLAWYMWFVQAKK